MAEPRQQDDLYRELMTWLTDGGLRYACAKQSGQADPQSYYQQRVDAGKKKHVIVVGAGMAGLTVAYELAQIGHQVTILERQSRVGGRVKTFREGFQDGLHSEGGAMRLPEAHFLTKHYIDHFQIQTKPFQFSQSNAYIYLFGTKIRISDFQQNNEKYSNMFWPGWDANLTPETKQQLNIKGIYGYLSQTILPVYQDLPDNPTAQDWGRWVEKWSKLSLEDFFRGTLYQSPDGPQLRPWPEAAINGFKSYNYGMSLEEELVEGLRAEIGEWVSKPMYTPTNGMDELPRAFTKPNTAGWNTDVNLSKNIVFGFQVQKVEITHDGPDPAVGRVKVTGVNRFTGMKQEFTGDAVFLTAPLHVLRQMDVPFTVDQRKALVDISYMPCTKIMLQCRTRFWQKDVGQGGASRTDTPIGQIVYPDYDGSGIADDQRGILLIYNFSTNALMLGGLSEEAAVKEAVREVAKLHPEIETEFEVGRMQAWVNDPAALGAFASLKPYEFLTSMKALKTPSPPIYLAGETISWANGWIQGALLSGLLQAYLFQSKEEGFGGTDPFDVV